MTHLQTLEMALEAFEIAAEGGGVNFYEYAKQLRQQIALEKMAENERELGIQMQPDEPVAWMFQHEETGQTMCVDAQQVEWGFEKNNPRLIKIAPLYTRPQPADEPVAVILEDMKGGGYIEWLDNTYFVPGTKFYTRPQPAAQWVGLTMEDKQEYVALDYGGNRLDAMDWAEKRLKEKNT